jgi:hypothetical protein
MAIVSLEDRVAVLESEVARLKEQMTKEHPRLPVPWWERIYGTFADSSEYEQAMRLGRAFREAQRPVGEEPAAE